MQCLDVLLLETVNAYQLCHPAMCTITEIGSMARPMASNCITLQPFPPLPSTSSPLPLPLLRSTLCARVWPSATPDDGPPRRVGRGAAVCPR